MFSLICARINGWVNNREAGDLRRHRAHYDVNVMESSVTFKWQSYNRNKNLSKYILKNIDYYTPHYQCMWAKTTYIFLGEWLLLSCVRGYPLQWRHSQIYVVWKTTMPFLHWSVKLLVQHGKRHGSSPILGNYIIYIPYSDVVGTVQMYEFSFSSRTVFVSDVKLAVSYYYDKPLAHKPSFLYCSIVFINVVGPRFLTLWLRSSESFGLDN